MAPLDWAGPFGLPPPVAELKGSLHGKVIPQPIFPAIPATAARPNVKFSERI